MTEPSQYFKGRTVQEQMNEVIGYVDARAEEVAAAKADDVLEPAEQAKTDAIAAKEAAEDARDTTLAALPAIQQDIADLKAEDVSLDGRLDTVELKVQTAEGNIVTIQGQIVALQTADGQNVKINRINDYALGLTGSQEFSGIKKATATGFFRKKSAQLDLSNPVISGASATDETFVLEDKNGATAVQMFNSYTPEAQTILQIASKYVFDDNGTVKTTNGLLWLAVYSDRVRLYLRYVDRNGTSHMKEIANVTETD